MAHHEDSSSSQDDPEREPLRSDSSSSSGSDELDIYSLRFNPSKALQHGKTMMSRLPFPNTRRLDNLHQYRQVLEAGDPEDFETNMVNLLKKRPLSRKSNKYVDPNEASTSPIQRRFLPHQMPIQRVNEDTEIRNLIQRMEMIMGPLAQLREYRDKRIRVCVKTRNIYGGLNEMIGFVIQFDKHWNLALQDVLEIFTRKRKSKVPPQLGPKCENVLSKEDLMKRGLFRPLVVGKVGKKLEKCERHVPQLLLRGEQVVLITPAM